MIDSLFFFFFLVILMSVIAFIAYSTAEIQQPPLKNYTKNSSTSTSSSNGGASSSGSSSSDSSSPSNNSSSSYSSSGSGSGNNNSSDTSSSPSSSSSSGSSGSSTSSHKIQNKRKHRPLQQKQPKPSAKAPYSKQHQFLTDFSQEIAKVNRQNAHISKLIDNMLTPKKVVKVLPNYNVDKTGNIVGDIVGNLGDGSIAQINNNNEGFASYLNSIGSSLKSFHVAAKVDNVFADLKNTFGKNTVLQKKNGNNNSNIISNIVSHKNAKSAVLFAAVNTIGKDNEGSGLFKIQQLSNNDSAKNTIKNI